ncbi:hypothetical protein [Paenibacillus sp. sgz302251]|uniref:hypothetical protein n=1 Tax=Paenibacillus sp. sgz302251 TaxID=3414493 RepID=UPI003C7A6032
MTWGSKDAQIAGESDLVEFQDKVYEVSKENKPIYNLVDFMKSDAVIDKAIHNIKSNHGSKAAGADG